MEYQVSVRAIWDVDPALELEVQALAVAKRTRASVRPSKISIVRMRFENNLPEDEQIRGLEFRGELIGQDALPVSGSVSIEHKAGAHVSPVK